MTWSSEGNINKEVFNKFVKIILNYVKLYNAYFERDITENWAKEQQHIKHVKPIQSIEERELME